MAMLADGLFYGLLILFLLWGLLWFILPERRSGLLNLFGLLFVFLLLLLGFSSFLPLYEHPVELKVTNYSSRKGELFFFKEGKCSEPVFWAFPVNANEVSRLEMEAMDIKQLVFLTEEGRLFELAPPEKGSRELEVWEKNLKEAPACYRELIADYRWEQTQFSISTGLLLYGLLLIFILKFNKKRINAACQ